MLETKKHYAIPAPFGKITLVVLNEEPCALIPSVEPLTQPDAAPEELLFWFDLLEDYLNIPRKLDAKSIERLTQLRAFTKLSDFAQHVLRTTLAISPATFVSYGELACACGMPQAARAVAQALAKNPFPILIGCHRIVPANFCENLDLTQPQTLQTQAYLGNETLAPIAAWLRLHELAQCP